MTAHASIARNLAPMFQRLARRIFDNGEFIFFVIQSDLIVYEKTTEKTLLINALPSSGADYIFDQIQDGKL